MPEGTLFAGALGGEGGKIGIIVDVGEMEIGKVDQTRVYVGLLDFKGRATGPVLTAGSLEVAEIGDCDGGVQGPEDIPFPVCGRGYRRGVKGGSVGRGCSCARDEGVGWDWDSGGGGVYGVGGGGAGPCNDGNNRNAKKEEQSRRKRGARNGDHAKEAVVSGLAGGSLVLDAQVFVNDGRNFIEGAGADELGHFVAADDENGRLGGDAVFSGLREVGGNGAFVGCIFHAGGEPGDVEAEGLSPCDLTFDAATAAAVLKSVVMVIPESALFAGTLRTFGDCTRLGAQDSVVTVDHFDLAVVHVGGLNLLGRTKGPAPTAASLEVAIVEDGDQGVGRAEDVPAAIRDIYGYRRCSGLGLLIGDVSCGGGLGCGGSGAGGGSVAVESAEPPQATARVNRLHRAMVVRKDVRMETKRGIFTTPACIGCGGIGYRRSSADAFR